MINSVLITGANRGLGLGLVKHLIGKNVKYIFATHRQRGEELFELATKNKNLQLIQLDLLNLNNYDGVVEKLSETLKEEGLNVLFNNAGVTTKFTKISLVKPEQLMENFQINTLAPIILTKKLLPLLKQASSHNANKPIGFHRAAVVNISSILGSIEKNDQGGFYPYRCSKAAINAATKSMSIDLKGDKIFAVAIHPGWVKTDMGGRHAPLDIDSSISGLLHTLQNLKEDDNGKFFQYNGESLPW